MSEIIFKAENVVKRYGSVNAIDHAEFQIEKGKIYGFIGQNGAGKTTFIRLITGMARADEGKIELFGKSDEKGLVEERKKLGCIIESPSFYPSMTAAENIRMKQILYGINDEEMPQRLLSMVGLGDTGKKKAKDFSLGMRQRLSIALALVNDPEFLVLDEPINGLDPVGIMEVRDILIKLNKEQNKTILISSHILSELYQLASDYIIIHKGKIVEELTQDELDGKCNKYIRVKVDNVEKAVSLINANFEADDIKTEENVISVYGNVEVEKLARLFMEEKVLVTELVEAGESLESYYVKLIGGADNE